MESERDKKKKKKIDNQVSNLKLKRNFWFIFFPSYSFLCRILIYSKRARKMEKKYNKEIIY